MLIRMNRCRQTSKCVCRLYFGGVIPVWPVDGCNMIHHWGMGHVVK